MLLGITKLRGERRKGCLGSGVSGGLAGSALTFAELASVSQEVNLTGLYNLSPGCRRGLDGVGGHDIAERLAGLPVINTNGAIAVMSSCLLLYYVDEDWQWIFSTLAALSAALAFPCVGL